MIQPIDPEKLDNLMVILPEDIIDFIYSKIIYQKPTELLNDIKYYSKIMKFIKIFKNTNIVLKNRYFQDVLIVYFSIRRQIKACSYVNYSVNNVPVPVWNGTFFKIQNDITPDKKMTDYCIKYMLEIPYNHLRYIFKRNRAPI